MLLRKSNDEKIFILFHLLFSYSTITSLRDITYRIEIVGDH